MNKALVHWNYLSIAKNGLDSSRYIQFRWGAEMILHVVEWYKKWMNCYKAWDEIKILLWNSD